MFNELPFELKSYLLNAVFSNASRWQSSA